jgi:HPt (histidine-containing phosphotransfer) domain-containing protein
MNPQSTPEPLKFDELLDRCMGEVEFAQKIVGDFLQSSEPLLRQIGQLIAESEVQEAARTVHRLKGTAATVAAGPFMESLRELEQLLRAEDTPDHALLREHLNGSCQRFLEIRQFVESRLLA